MKVPVPEPAAKSNRQARSHEGFFLDRERVSKLILGIAVLIAVFGMPLWNLAVLAVSVDLHSHVLLIPFVTGYLLYVRRRSLPRVESGSPRLALLFAVVGASVGAVAFLRWNSFEPTDRLALLILSFVVFVQALGLAVLGVKWMKAAAFPMAFLVFMVPMPDTIASGLETGLKFASADAAGWFFEVAGVPVLRDGVFFRLPGLTIEVAKECSGIRSTYVLFITSLLASYLFLKNPWHRFVLVAAVIPLGIVRNGFRILVLGWLCVNYGPELIHTWIHHRGGPVFFVLSLVPFFLLLWGLYELERRQSKRASRKAAVAGVDEP